MRRELVEEPSRASRDLASSGGGFDLLHCFPSPRHSKANLILQLPAEGLARHRRSQSEQHATVKFQGTGPEVVDCREQLWSDTMVLLADRSKMAKSTGLTV